MPPIGSTELCTFAVSRSVPPASGDRLNLTTDWHSATVVRIGAHGEVDASNIDRLARYVFRYGANSRRLLLDMSDVKFFAVECFSVLQTIDQRCAAAGVSWTLVPSAAVSRVLQLCDPRRARLTPTVIAKQRRQAG